MSHKSKLEYLVETFVLLAYLFLASAGLMLGVSQAINGEPTVVNADPGQQIGTEPMTEVGRS